MPALLTTTTYPNLKTRAIRLKNKLQYKGQSTDVIDETIVIFNKMIDLIIDLDRWNFTMNSINKFWFWKGLKFNIIPYDQLFADLFTDIDEFISENYGDMPSLLKKLEKTNGMVKNILETK